MTELEIAKMDIIRLEKVAARLTERVEALEKLIAKYDRDVPSGFIRRPPPEGVELGSL